MNRKELGKIIQNMNNSLQNGDTMTIKSSCIKDDIINAKGIYLTDEDKQLEVMYINNQGKKETIIIDLDKGYIILSLNIRA